MDTNKLWFTSDNHFGHKNIIEFSKRPFTTVDEMNAEMVKRWNEKVGQNNIVYHLGDFALMPPKRARQLREQLNKKFALLKATMKVRRWNVLIVLNGLKTITN